MQGRQIMLPDKLRKESCSSIVDPLPELPWPHSFFVEKDPVKIRQTFETGTIRNLRYRVIRFAKQMAGMADPYFRKIIRECLAGCPLEELAKRAHGQVDECRHFP